MTVELGSVYCYQRSGTKSRLIEKKETFQYIPLIENLQSVLQNKDIYSEVSQPIVKFLPLAVWFMQFGSCSLVHVWENWSHADCK